MTTTPYKSPRFLINAHVETIFPSLFRKVQLTPYTRERILTPDNDFLDLDWIINQSKTLVIISHGLEGNTQRPYVKGMARAAIQSGFDVLAWNYRGCSEELNQQLRFYHSGATDDLDLVIQHALAQERYDTIYLVGFSLGGNLTLKYLGESAQLHPSIKRSVVFSVPMDLKSSCEKISRRENWIYARRFLRSLKEKIVRKSLVMPGIDSAGMDNIKTLEAFDDRFTAPLHGFKDANDYYHKNSSLYFVNEITIPTLIVSAQNDPFLSPQCYPYDLLLNHPYVSMQSPSRGGHVGFTQFNRQGQYWSEAQAMSFLKA